jgi:hypothetical protein
VDGAAVVGCMVGSPAATVGWAEGSRDGSAEGDRDGSADGSAVGSEVGDAVDGDAVVGTAVGSVVGSCVGAVVTGSAAVITGDPIGTVLTGTSTMHLPVVKSMFDTSPHTLERHATYVLLFGPSAGMNWPGVVLHSTSLLAATQILPPTEDGLGAPSGPQYDVSQRRPRQ